MLNRLRRRAAEDAFDLAADQGEPVRIHVFSPFKWVREFHYAFGMPVGTTPGHLSDERLELRWALIHEEYLEVSEAIDDAKDDPSRENLLALVKELADLIYVVEGMAVELGVDLDKVVAEVHRSNMTKLDEDGAPIYRADGKVLKGPNYEVADLGKVVFGD